MQEVLFLLLYRKKGKILKCMLTRSVFYLIDKFIAKSIKIYQFYKTSKGYFYHNFDAIILSFTLYLNEFLRIHECF